ncbi:MAG: peptidylprolyl isomerase [Bacteroidetes bacterium]|nr:peptidylprolyl isomerase [Bacteroidota bacterium]
MKPVQHSQHLLFIGLVLLSMAIAAPVLQAQQKNSVVAEIGDYELTLGEFERQFIRNNGGETVAARSKMEERKDFLELLVKYRLKVLEAREKGYDQDEDILRELSEYRNSLAVPYLIERALIDPKIESLYEQRLEEVRAAHVLIRISVDSTGIEDTLTAYNKAMDVIRMARDGVPFDSLARTYSDDPGTKDRGGDLLWFSAGMTVPEFDQAIYAMSPGQVRPRPVRTAFGYHVVKLINRQPVRGEIQVGHILVRTPQDAPDDTTAAYEKITSIRDSLRSGERFVELARRNSEDPSSAADGGDLGWVGRNKFVPDFEVVAFELEPGEISRPVRTPFGYHLITVFGERPPKEFEDARQELKDLYRRYSFEKDEQEFIRNIVEKHNANVQEDVTAMIISSVDTTATTSAPGWYNRITDALKDKVWVRFDGHRVTVGDAIRIIERDQDMQSLPLNRSSLAGIVSMIAEKEAQRLETEDLETRFPEFGALMQEYREGVLLFRAEQESVWNSVQVDEDRLRDFWAKRKADFTWPDRVRFSEIFVTSDSLAEVLRDSLDNGVDFAELAARHTQRAGYKNKNGDWGFQPYDANELAQKAAESQPGSIAGPMKYQYGYSIIKVMEKDQAREKTFDEARSEASSKFQEYESKRLEREWIRDLKNKFGVTIHEDVLETAFSDLKLK